MSIFSNFDKNYSCLLSDFCWEQTALKSFSWGVVLLFKTNLWSTCQLTTAHYNVLHPKMLISTAMRSMLLWWTIYFSKQTQMYIEKHSPLPSKQTNKRCFLSSLSTHFLLCQVLLTHSFDIPYIIEEMFWYREYKHG